jgi:hypothetical protein
MSSACKKSTEEVKNRLIVHIRGISREIVSVGLDAGVWPISKTTELIVTAISAKCAIEVNA